MGIEIAKDGVGVAKDCWEFSGNECGWKKKMCSCKNLGGLKKIMQIKGNVQMKILILLQLQCHTWL